MIRPLYTQPETVLVKADVLYKLLDFTEAILQGEYTKRVITDFGDDLITRIAGNLNKFADKMQLDPSGSQVDSEKTVNTFIDVIGSYTNLDFKHKLQISQNGTIWDAVATGINMLGDELEQSTASRHELEQERNLLKIAKQQAEEANVAKSRFLANMSHEIRTPLNGILGLTQIMQGETNSTEHQKYLDMIHTSGKNLSQLINDILDFSKIESGRLELENIPFNLGKVINSEAERFKILAERKGLFLNCHVDEAIPQEVLGDQVRIAQIMANIIGNSIKFTEAGGISVVFSLKETKAGKIVVEGKIKDTGIGIPKDAIEKIFESFSQADNSVTRKFGGTGLGLSIVKSLVQAMDGNISVNSPADTATNRGSLFTFTLELGVPKQVTKQPLIPGTTDSVKGSVRVLIVDDNHVNLLVAKKMCEKFGAIAVTADNGVTAIDLANNQKFDLVLMDIQMPDVDGHETTRRLREGNFKKPIIALSASAYSEDIQKSLASGMNGHLQKPFTEKDLFKVVSSVDNLKSAAL